MGRSLTLSRWADGLHPSLSLALMTLGRLKPLRRSGTENFRDGATPFNFTVLDFWRWAASDLVSNALRGRVAEFLVAKSVGIGEDVRNEWDSCDLLLPSGVTVEVKSAAYLQTWGQTAESPISFRIRPTRAWDAETNKFASAEDVRRQADIYVFALLDHREKATVDPLDVSQWEFRLLCTSVVDNRCARQKRISLSRLDKLEPLRCRFADLAACIASLESLCTSGAQRR